MHPIVKGIGFSLLAIVLLGIAVSVVAAILQNKAFLWTNAYGLPVGTYSTAAVLVVAAGAGVFWLFRRTRLIFSRRHAKRLG
jgi:hypothetical protein